MDTDGDGIREKDGQKLVIRWLTYPSRQELPLLAESVQATLKAIGIEVDINCTASRREFLADMTSFDIYASALVTAPSGDPQYFFTTSCLPGMSYNFGAYENEHVNDLMNQMATEFDTARRGELAIELQQAILDDNAYIFCSFLQMNMISKVNVSNYTAHGIWRCWQMRVTETSMWTGTAGTASIERSTNSTIPRPSSASPRGNDMNEAILMENRTYWTHRAPSYSEVNREELATRQHVVWKQVLTEQISARFPDRILEQIYILEIGTGPDFFAILLAEEGYRVTAIDMTPSMLDEARSNADKLCDYIDFQEMNAEKLSFHDACFDVILSRNVTWNLTEPEKAYAEWARVLKPGGLLMTFDAKES